MSIDDFIRRQHNERLEVANLIKEMLLERPDAKRRAFDWLVEVFEDNGVEHLTFKDDSAP